MKFSQLIGSLVNPKLYSAKNLNKKEGVSQGKSKGLIRNFAKLMGYESLFLSGLHSQKKTIIFARFMAIKPNVAQHKVPFRRSFLLRENK